MSSFIHAKLIIHIINNEKISDLSAESDERQLKVYSLALSKLRDNIEKYQPIEIPYETIRDGSEVLNELSIILVPMSLRDVEESFRIKDVILPLVEAGLASVSQAKKIYEQERKKARRGNVQKEDLPQEYDNNVIIFRRKVIELHEHLREG